MDMENLFAWCCKLHFDEDKQRGLGSIEIRFYLRDDFKELKRIYDNMSREDAKDIAVRYIDFIASPCHGYDEDMDYHLSLDEESEEIVIIAKFRM